MSSLQDNTLRRASSVRLQKHIMFILISDHLFDMDRKQL